MHTRTAVDSRGKFVGKKKSLHKPKTTDTVIRHFARTRRPPADRGELGGNWGGTGGTGENLKQNRNDENGHDIDHLDHGIDRGPGGVLVRIADGVTGYCGLMGRRTFAAVIAFFDILF